MLDKRVLILTSGLLAIFLISGCAGNEGTTGSATSKMTSDTQQTGESATSTYVEETYGGEAWFVGNFYMLPQDDALEWRFSLMDANRGYVAQDGIARIKIVDSEGKNIYENSFQFNKEDFRMYTLLLTNEDFLSYTGEIPLADIPKSLSYVGTAYLKVTTASAIFEELETSVYGLPSYTDEELEELNEEKYLESAITIGNKINRGTWEITLERVGLYTPLVTFGEEKDYFRADFKVTNIGSEQDYFMPNAMVVLDNQGNQFEIEYCYACKGALDMVTQIYPGITKRGYVLFEAIPETTTSAKIAFQLGYDTTTYDLIYYEFPFNLYA